MQQIASSNGETLLIKAKNIIPCKTVLAESIVSYGLSSNGRTFKIYMDRIYSHQIRILKQIIPFKIKEKF